MIDTPDTLNPRHEHLPRAAALPRSCDTPGTTAQKQRVLLVDDEIVITRVFSAILRSSGFVVDVAGSGAHALERMALQEFDVIVTDIQMPGLCGVGLVRAMRERAPLVPIVILSGDHGPPGTFEGTDLGVIRLLAKPVSLVDLIAAVRMQH